MRHLRRRRDGLRRLRPRPARARARPAAQPAAAWAAAPRRRAAKLAATADVPVGGGVILTDAQLVITQPKAGTFKAFSAICTHQGCAVSTVENGTINCPCHGSEFAITDGSVVAGPAPEAAARADHQGVRGLDHRGVISAAGPPCERNVRNTAGCA